MEKSWLADICLPVYLLVIVFNLASWIDLNAMWVEMPLLVNRLPEGWDLPSYFIIIIQCSKFALITYAILKKFLKDKLKEWPFVYIIIGIGAASLFISGFIWEKTMFIGEREVSIAILSMTAILSTVDSLSSVVFLPYMSRFKSQYITAFFVGEGVCQLLPAIVSMIQGVGETPECRNTTVYVFNNDTGVNETEYKVEAIYPDPRFSVRTFFIFMSGVMICSGVSFTFLHFLPYCRKEHVHSGSTEKDSVAMNSADLQADAILLRENSVKEEKDVSATNPMLSDHPGKETEKKRSEEDSKQKLTKADFIYCILVLAFSFGLMYGVLPGLQPYAALPYGNRAYNLAIRLGVAMNPTFSFLALFVSTRSKTVLNVLYAIGTCMFAYQVVLACLSPFPPLKGTATGETLAILTFVILMAMYNYCRSCIMYMLDDGGTGLMWGGCAMHLGCAIGAIIGFILTSVLKLFEAEPPCPGMSH